jgi:hypothetical protein
MIAPGTICVICVHLRLLLPLNLLWPLRPSAVPRPLARCAQRLGRSFLILMLLANFVVLGALVEA